MRLNMFIHAIYVTKKSNKTENNRNKITKSFKITLIFVTYKLYNNTK